MEMKSSGILHISGKFEIDFHNIKPDLDKKRTIFCCSFPRRGRDRMVVGFITTYAISLNPA
jgi:hypothetical protein